MDATATLGTWKKVLWHTVAFALTILCAYLFPPLTLILSLALPLVACPALAQGDVWFALGLPTAPAVAYLAAGGDPVFGLLIPLFSYLCLLTVSLGRRRNIRFNTETLGCSAAFLVSALCMLARLSELLGGPLFTQLARHIVTAVRNSPLSGAILYRLVSLGFLPLPAAYRNSAAFQFGRFMLIDPGLQRELLNMLLLRLNEGFSVWIPSLLMQGAVILGLFTTYTAERAHARREGAPSTMPSFQTLHLPRREQGYMLALCLGTVIASLSTGTLARLVCTLMYSTFATVYQLLGAAVLTFLLSRRHASRAPLYGLLAVILYIVFPIALFLLGVVDQFANLRASSLHHQEEE